MVVYNFTYEKSAAGIAVYFPCLWPDYYGDTRFEMTCVGFPESYFEFLFLMNPEVFENIRRQQNLYLQLNLKSQIYWDTSL